MLLHCRHTCVVAGIGCLSLYYKTFLTSALISNLSVCFNSITIKTPGPIPCPHPTYSRSLIAGQLYLEIVPSLYAMKAAQDAEIQIARRLWQEQDLGKIMQANIERLKLTHIPIMVNGIMASALAASWAIMDELSIFDPMRDQ